jgi:hypothetical protein
MPHEQEDTTRVLYIPDHEDQLIALVPSQFRDEPRWQALLKAMAEGLQVMEDQFFSLIVSRTLAASSGAQLDQWGDMVGEPRDGATDAVYRVFIEARIFANNATGIVNDFIFLLQTTTAPSTVRHLNIFPACCQFDIRVAVFMSELQRGKVRRLLESVRPGGVCFLITEAADGSFGFFADPDAFGFGEGTFSRVL